MILDCHIHIQDGPVDQAGLLARMRRGGVDGGVLLSLPPKAFGRSLGSAPPRRRLENLRAWTAGAPDLFPFYWLDPTEADAARQVDLALAAGVRGFKVICNHFPAGDRRAMRIYRRIAAAGRPILFHSGILWDGQPSSRFNRPSEWECMLEIPGLRFALAHISWPWTDECIAVYGKFQSAFRLRPDVSCEMFIDLTPGTPPIYRSEALTRLFTVGYQVSDHLLFGTDCSAPGYDQAWAAGWMRRDNRIYARLGLSRAVRAGIHGANLRRFLGDPPGA